MEIKGKDILVLGGWGLVGMAVCRKLIPLKPKSITIASLTQEQAESACTDLRTLAHEIEFKPVWGNIFVRAEMKDFSREEILGNRENRLNLAEDVLERTTETFFHKFFLYQMITEFKPQIIIDCVNTATGVAYQDIFSAGLRVLKGVRGVADGVMPDDLVVEVEKLLDSLYVPQLVRHVQVLYHAMKQIGTQSYVKVGTSGTGGMGLNIPYTHSEDKPSRVLLSKTSIAGAHSLLLFLMGRTPDAPNVKEVKPATAIAWKRITHDEVLKGGKPIPLFDCPAEGAVKLKDTFNTEAPETIRSLGENLKGVFIDTGENGTFSLGEFTAITTHDQMEYITPEEIAQTILWEIQGCASGHDIVGALDASVLSSTYRAGIMRSLALDKMKKLTSDYNDSSVAYELLGPPRLSKLLWEAHLLKQAAGSISSILNVSPAFLSEKTAQLVQENSELRSRIISIGIPILLPDGVSLLRGAFVKVPQDPRQNKFEINSDTIAKWSESGWVDLREANMLKWQTRLKKLMAQTAQLSEEDTSSASLRDRSFWKAEETLDEGEIVGWLFIDEDEGRRMK